MPTSFSYYTFSAAFSFLMNDDTISDDGQGIL